MMGDVHENCDNFWILATKEGRKNRGVNMRGNLMHHQAPLEWLASELGLSDLELFATQ